MTSFFKQGTILVFNYSPHLQAYSSFGSTGNTDLLQHKPYAALADKYKCTVPQLLLAWALCQGFSVLPKSTNANHICANFESLKVKLSDEDIETMKWTEQKKFCWDPKSVAWIYCLVDCDMENKLFWWWEVLVFKRGGNCFWTRRILGK